MKKFLKMIFLIFLISTSYDFCQNIATYPLITLPGKNYDLNTSPPDVIGIPNTETFISWINFIDSNYTVYLKQISPIIGENIIVSSDSLFKSKPQIAWYSEGIKIAWQCREQNYWHVHICDFSLNHVSNQIIILDSLINNPQISLSNWRIAWIDDGKLFYSQTVPEISDKVLVDSGYCSLPDLYKFDGEQIVEILYEKKISDSTKIFHFTYNNYLLPEFKIQYEDLSKGISSENPKFGSNMDLTYEIKENNVWKIVYSKPFIGTWDTTTNKSCDYNNPIILTRMNSTVDNVPDFIAFESDSLTNNKEIFIKSFYYDKNYEIENISKNIGNDTNPKVIISSTTDTAFVGLIWENNLNDKSEIWIAKDIFSGVITSIENKENNIYSYKLFQNYPNPFNPSTKIRYSLQKSGNIKIYLYDILGKEITKLIDEYKNAGNYEIEFNANNLSNGIYIYRLISNNYSETKKMILLK